MKKDFVVTPWEVRGKIDYDRLVKEFGLSLIDEALYKKLEKYTGESIFLKRKIFFAHRDLDFVLSEYEKGNKFYLYNGRGPSGNTHIGHLVSFLFAKKLQEAFDVKYLIQLTDDEKFLFKENLNLNDVEKFTYENALDIIALGFDHRKTKIISDLNYAKTMYREALKVAKKLNFSTVKAVFGFTNETNVGSIFFTSMQSVPAFLESVKEGKNIPCLIPHGIDQDPHFRIARDILPKLGFYKPASIECKIMPGLGKEGKMSASEPSTCIFTTDTPETVRKKIMNAFTGGRETAELQRKYGGNPEICSVYQYYYFLFEEDNGKLKNLHERCKNGSIICGDCKKMLSEKIEKFIVEHQKKREKARDLVDKFMLKD